MTEKYDSSLPTLLDNDLYKFTMQQAILELFSDAQAEYTFINRGNHTFNENFTTLLRSNIEYLSQESVSPTNLGLFAEKCPYLKPWYLEFLKSHRPDPKEVSCSLDEEGKLQVVVKGPWYRTVLWEVPLLAIISMLYYHLIDTNWPTLGSLRSRNWGLYYDKARQKFGKLNYYQCSTSDFGTRRRRCYAAQDAVVAAGKEYLGQHFMGTSNVHFALKYDVPVRGTMAHEWIMAMSVLEGLRNANYYALQNWVRVYNANLGTALSDTYGIDAFLRNFNLRLSKLYDGTRQDSGDPQAYVDKLVNHYRNLGIDPLSKYILFSDNLNVDKAIDLTRYCYGKIKCAFGIGTHLTNDFENSPALNIVMKLNKLNGIPVTKLGADALKECGDKDALRVVKWIIQNQPLD